MKHSGIGWLKKNIILVGTCTTFGIGGVAALAGSGRINTVFSPEAYLEQQEERSQSVQLDDTVFGANAGADNNALEMDENTKDEYQLEEGQDTHIQDHNNREEQIELAVGGGNTGERQENDNNVFGGNAGSVNENPDAPVLNIGNGQPGNLPGGGDGDSMGIGTGNGTAGSDDDDHGETGTGGGGGTSDPSPTPEPGPSPEPTPEPTPEPGPAEDPDDDKYGVDYDTPEDAGSSYPDADKDEASHVYATELIVEGSLMQHFYWGEAPRIDEMGDYLTVSARMSDGSVRTNLKYRATSTTGGDYQVAWSEAAGSETGNLGYMTAGNKSGIYAAVISYRGRQTTVKYDVVDWQVELENFEEGNVAFDARTLQPEGKPLVDLQSAIKEMRTVIEERGPADGIYYNRPPENQLDDFHELYAEFFGGWSQTQDSVYSVGNTFLVTRPTDEQIEQFVYKTKLYPIWIDGESRLNDCSIIFNNTQKSTQLFSYEGDSDTIVVPSVVEQISLTTMNVLAPPSEGKRTRYYPGIRKIVIPESVSSIDQWDAINLPNMFPDLTGLEVAEDNQHYLSIDDILYNKTGKKLLWCPAAKPSVEKWSKNVDTIGDSAFAYINMEQIIFPETVTELMENCFMKASLYHLEITSAGSISIGANAFWPGSANEEDRGSGLETLTIDSSLLPDIHSGSFNELTGFRELHIPGSEKDELYLKYIRNYYREFSDIEASKTRTTDDAGCDAVYRLLYTEDAAETRYTCKDGSLLSADEKTLELVPDNVSGIYTASDTVTEIKEKAFLGCSKVGQLYLSKAVRTLEPGCLQPLTGLKILAINTNQIVNLNEISFRSQFNEDMTIYVPLEEYQAYLSQCMTQELKNCIAALDSPNVFPRDNGLYLLEEDGLHLHQAVEQNDKIYDVDADVLKIDDGAFSKCSTIQWIVLPDTVVALGSNLCAEDTKLVGLIVQGQAAPVAQDDTFSEAIAADIMIYYPNTSDSSDYTGAGWNRIPAVQKVGDYDSYTLQRITKATPNPWILYGSTEDTLTLISADQELPATFTILENTEYIADGAFKNHTKISYVDGTKNVVRVGNEAFYGCTDLRTVDLAKSLKTIGDRAFAGTALASLNWHDQTTSLESLGDEAFRDCRNLVGIYFPESLTSIGASCFEGCTALRGVGLSNLNYDLYILFPRAVSHLGKRAFAGCTALTGVHFNAGAISRLEDETFYGCTSLTNIYFTNAITFIGTSCFENCVALRGCPVSNLSNGPYILMPTGLAAMGEKVFAGCISITGVHFNECPLKIIEKQAFYGCKKLIYLYPSSKTVTIGDSAFENCSALVGWTASGFGNDVPELAYMFAALQNVGDRAFAGCSTLAGFYFWSNQINWGTDAIKGCNNIKVIYGSAGNLGLFLNGFEEEVPVRDLYVWGDMSDEKYNFSNWTKLTNLKIGNNNLETTLNDGMAAGNTSLKTVTLSGILCDLGKGCFEKCSSLETITITGYPTEIPDSWCKECENLSAVIWNSVYTDTIQRIGISAFQGCKNLTSITFLDTNSNGGYCKALTTIDDFAFKDCVLLSTTTKHKWLHLPYGLKKIGKECFANTGIVYVSIYSSIQETGSRAFQDCKSLAQVQLMDSITVDSESKKGIILGEEEFIGCDSLKNVVVIGALSVIGKRTFAGCKSLVQFRWQETDATNYLQEIGEEAFAGCTSLPGLAPGTTTTNLTNDAIKMAAGPLSGAVFFRGTNRSGLDLFNSLVSVGKGAFSGCAKLKGMSIPKSLKALPEEMFQGCEILGNVELSSSVTKIGDRCFARCPNLSELTWIDDLTASHEYSLASSSNLTGVMIPASLESLGEESFAGCTGIKNVRLNKMFDFVNLNAFDGCSKIETLVLDADLKETEVSGSMISPFSSTAEIAVYGKIETLAAPIASWSNLTEVYVDESAQVDYLGEELFAGNPSLRSVQIDTELSGVESRCFADCPELESVVLYCEDESAIHADAFEGCSEALVVYVNDKIWNPEEILMEPLQLMEPAVPPPTVLPPPAAPAEEANGDSETGETEEPETEEPETEEPETEEPETEEPETEEPETEEPETEEPETEEPETEEPETEEPETGEPETEEPETEEPETEKPETGGGEEAGEGEETGETEEGGKTNADKENDETESGETGEKTEENAGENGGIDNKISTDISGSGDLNAENE